MNSKKMKKKVKAIVFDVGGVLQLGYKRVSHGHQSVDVHEYMAKKFGLSIDEWFDSIDTAYANSVQGSWSKERVLGRMAKNLKTNPNKLYKLWIKAHKKKFSKNRKLFRIAKKLKKKGYIVGVLSDQFHFSKEALIDKSTRKLFNLMVISCEEGIRKPNIKIYKLLKKKLEEKFGRIRYKEILFIDNRDWNLKPAKKLGMKTILFKNNKQLLREMMKFVEV